MGKNRKGQKRKALSIREILSYILLTAVAITTLIPFFWMVSTAFKLEKDVFHIPIQWIPETVTLNNFKRVFTEIPFPLYYFNSLKLAVLVTVIKLLLASMGAFAFAKLRFPGKNVLFMIYLSAMMIPGQVIMIPQFLLINQLGLNNTHLAILCLQCFDVFGIFMLRQFFRGIPTELIEAAKIDGAGYIQVYLRIILPLGLPAMSALAIIGFIGSMNDFLTPFLYLEDERLKTITLGIRSLTTEYEANYTMQMAGTLCGLLPILLIYAVGQKQIIRGIAFGGGGGIKE